MSANDEYKYRLEALAKFNDTRLPSIMNVVYQTYKSTSNDTTYVTFKKPLYDAFYSVNTVPGYLTNDNVIYAATPNMVSRLDDSHLLYAASTSINDIYIRLHNDNGRYVTIEQPVGTIKARINELNGYPPTRCCVVIQGSGGSGSNYNMSTAEGGHGGGSGAFAQIMLNLDYWNQQYYPYFRIHGGARGVASSTASVLLGGDGGPTYLYKIDYNSSTHDWDKQTTMLTIDGGYRASASSAGTGGGYRIDGLSFNVYLWIVNGSSGKSGLSRIVSRTDPTCWSSFKIYSTANASVNTNNMLNRTYPGGEYTRPTGQSLYDGSGAGSSMYDGGSSGNPSRPDSIDGKAGSGYKGSGGGGGVNPSSGQGSYCVLAGDGGDNYVEIYF